MKKLFLLLALLAASVQAAVLPDCINLADYVKPGSKDDTEAVRAAIAAAQKQRKAIFVPGPRTYRLTDTIEINSYGNFFGVNHPTFEMKNPEKDIFVGVNTWRAKISGIQFRGGKDQIVVGNSNIDQGHIVIENCRFFNASGAAIRFTKRTYSTQAIVEKCAFWNCVQSLIAVTDQTIFRDSWITTANKNPKNLAVIENYGVLLAENILGVPHVVSDDLRWIDNHASLTCRLFRFGGEGGGFTPVVNYAKYRPALWGYYVILDNCYIGNEGNTKRDAAVYCEEIPNLITIQNSQVAGVPPVAFAKKIDLKTYFKEANPGMIRYSSVGNMGEFLSDNLAEYQKAIQSVNNKKLGNPVDPALIKKFLDSALKKAKTMPSPKQPGKVLDRKKKVTYTQKTKKGEYYSITTKTHKWSTDDLLDGLKIKASDKLAVTGLGESTIICQLTDEGKWAHIRVKDLEVDLDKMPVLSWNLRWPLCKGGHIAVKIVDQATGKQIHLMEDYQNSMFRYCAYDLRKYLKKNNGKVKVDVKVYLCSGRIGPLEGPRVKGGLTYTPQEMKAGEFFVIDFLRLEKAD